MSVIKDRTATKPPPTARTTWFPGCFGCSGHKMQPTEEVNSGSRSRWKFKWKSICKKSDIKTVPFDVTTDGRKSKSFRLSKAQAPAKSSTTWEIQVLEEDATLTKKSVIMVEETHAPATSDEQKTNRKKWVDSVKRQNGNRSRRKETKTAVPIVTSAGGAGLTRHDSHPEASSASKTLTRSTSPPPAKGKKLPPSPPADGGVDEGGLNKTPAAGDGFDSLIGVSVILVTLVIMMLWGRLCAILCTSAWFFIAPRLGGAGKRSAVGTAGKRLPESHNKLDLESVEYKKKVVLEGLLQRNHRNIVGRL